MMPRDVHPATANLFTWLNTVRDFMSLAGRDALRSVSEPSSLDQHLGAAIEWLKRAQDQCNGGVSYGYSIRGGWQPAYRETSGYILTTFFRAADELNDAELALRALRIAEWLVEVQNDDGSFSNPKYGRDGIVFDTGQDLFGLVRAYERSGDGRFLAAARRAADWLVRVADARGRWMTHEHLNTPHVYNTRTAWALALLNRITRNPRFEDVARANLEWALECQQDSGYFRNAAFVSGQHPYTHNISYTTCGLQESGWILDEPRYVAAARRCADAALALLRPDGFLPGQISVDGQGHASYACLTGTCQFAIVWAKWFALTSDAMYQQAAIRHGTTGGQQQEFGDQWRDRRLLSDLGPLRAA
jgi:uncharacterized protein YyaL (SSP411 family)